MSPVSRYWQLVQINDATGKCKVDDISSAKAFFQQQFGNLTQQAKISDGLIQRELMNLFRQDDTAIDRADRQLAELCLRCFISHLIEQTCIQLEVNYGAKGNFTRYNLFPLVLEDDSRSIQRTIASSPYQYQSLSAEILQTFDPTQSSLSTWVPRQVQRHRELHRFLLEHGVYLMSDWAILNDTPPNRLRRVLSEFYTFTPLEIEQAHQLLQSYHEIYRHDRLRQRQAGMLKSSEKCLQPTSEQLIRMRQSLQAKAALTLSTEDILDRLQTIAQWLRDYRIYVRSGKQPAESLETQILELEMPDPESDSNQNEQEEFLTFYREQFLHSLRQTIEQVIHERITYLEHRKSPQTAQQFVLALYLFHCQGQSMSKIACEIGLKAQYQVTRLMNLKELRGAVRQKLLSTVSDRILNQAKIYANPSLLQTLDERIEAALDEQISMLIQQAETESSVAKNCPLSSLFARELCRYLETRSVSHD